jgi:endonuclease V-like protein UPF0215 family
MIRIHRPHLLGIDDGPFEKGRDERAPIVGVLMEGQDLVEAVVLTDFPVDGAEPAEFLATWIAGLRFVSGLHGIVLGGITIAGLGIVDTALLSERLDLPVMVVNRHAPTNDRLSKALDAAGFAERIAIVERAPAAWELDRGLWVSHVGTDREEAERLLRAARGKSLLPEPVRLAHLIGGAVATGHSRGRP